MSLVTEPGDPGQVTAGRSFRLLVSEERVMCGLLSMEHSFGHGMAFEDS